jgi:phage terminase small subunit
MKAMATKKSVVKPPPHLSEAAAGWWDHVNRGWDLDPAALLILESALEAYDRMKEAQVLVSKKGIMTQDRFGQDKLNPAVLVERDSRSAMLAAFKQLNLDIEPLNERPGRPVGR